MFNPTQYIRMLLGVIVGILFIWVGVTGRLGSLLGALITPDFMTNGQEPGVGAYSTYNLPQAPTSPVGTYNAYQIAGVAYGAGLKTQVPLAMSVAIALAESGGQVAVVNSIGATGLWQIYIAMHPQYTTKQMQDPVQNAAAMFAISSGGTNWNPWQTYTNGSYKQFLGQGNTAAQQIISSGGPQ